MRINQKKRYRLYREERLTVRRRGGRKWALRTRAPMVMPQKRNQPALDFVSDALVDGRRFRILTAINVPDSVHGLQPPFLLLRLGYLLLSNGALHASDRRHEDVPRCPVILAVAAEDEFESLYGSETWPTPEWDW